MRVVQVAGPSYSGSTVLGYVLNASPGWFFGSEVYRVLPTFRHVARGGARVYCAVCGQDCPYWTDTVRERVAAVADPSVRDVYRVFSQEHPEVACFVDGSKSLRWFDGAWTETQVLSAKHPMRMLASFLLHRPERLGLPATATFEDFRAAIAADPRRLRRVATRTLVTLRRIYQELMEQAPRAQLCRSDELHLDDFAGFRQLCAFVGTEPVTEHLLGFGDHPVHPLGGNKAPLWQRLEKEPAAAAPTATVTTTRRRYYAETASPLGDYKMDDKWAQIFLPDLAEEIAQTRPYRKLCRLLGYPRGLPAAAAAPGPVV